MTRRSTALLCFLAACSDAEKSGIPFQTGETTSPSDSGDPVETLSPPATPWLRDERPTPGPISFNELHYHPGHDDGIEWIELHNPMVLDIDLTDWLLEGGIDYRFDEGTVIAAGGYLVVAADPGRIDGAVGPWSGTLSDSGERIDLRNNSGRYIDSIAYTDDAPWPVHPDGSGFSLAKRDPDSATDHAESWTASVEPAGTPGASNQLNPLTPPTTVALVGADATWAYHTSGAYPATDWAEPGYDDSGWSVGEASFYAGAPQDDIFASAWVTADNYYGLYLGGADGADLRLVGPDPDGDWTTADPFELWVGPSDHLYLAAWEAPGDSTSPQMTIAELELDGRVIGTNIADFEWVLGPAGDCPGTPDPPPTEPALGSVIDEANTRSSWAPPGVEADKGSEPWGWALSGAFSADTRYVWSDTFDNASITNTENTYVLFRSTEPLFGVPGTTEIPTIPTTVTFRTPFTLDADPAATTLLLEHLIDDGAVVYLNGVEVLRVNLPAGPIDADTLAALTVGDAAWAATELPRDALLRGTNVLAVELHQAETDDPDLRFGCALTASIAAAAPGLTLVLDEVPPAGTSPFWVELLDRGGVGADVDGLVLGTPSGEQLVSAEGLTPGGRLVIDDLDLEIGAGDPLFLYSADRSTLLDAVRVQAWPRGRLADGGPWGVPIESTPGEPNTFELVEDVVIHEIQYHRAPVSRDGEPVVERPEEWIELTNRGPDPVDLGGWTFTDAITYTFPAGTILAPGAYLVVANDAATLSAAHPSITVLGDFSGRLDNTGERILLLDARGNTADEVHYFDDGRWPAAADGAGSSLELRDVRADNGAGEAWAASDETHGSSWTDYRYRGVAEPSAVGPDGVWEELVVGLLDAGEVWLDDLSVIQDPDTAPTELLNNGSFDVDSEHWRLLGNHQHSEIVADPDDPANPVLRLVATGPTGHMHNHAETTLRAPVGAREYEISFRARAISGSNQLNTRLYFNRLPRTTRVKASDQSGTPGAPNSRTEANIGPTFAGLDQDVALPAAGQAVSVRVTVDDPDGVAGMTLFSSVAGATFVAEPMAETTPGRWSATLPGQAAGTLVQLYVEAEDRLGVRSFFPAAGPDSRALVQFDDGRSTNNGLHNFRILMTEFDSDWLLDEPNLMSDDRLGATVIYNDTTVFHDVGVRAKGSERGRPEVPRLGYGVNFTSEQPFRGRHKSVLIDRSEGVGYGQREVLMNLVMTQAGSVSGEYNDLVYALTPRSEHTGAAELQLDRVTAQVLDAQFTNGSSGTLFEYELIYYPLTTDDGTPEGLKLPQPDSVIGTAVTDLGADPEDWRWNFLIQNNEREDDYTGMMELGRAFAQPDFPSGADEVLDVDQWLRAFAFATLSGAVDNYGGDGSQHNGRFYVRPEDQKLLFFPHDLDFYGSSSMSVVGNNDLSRMLQVPEYSRAYYGHLLDIIQRAYNTTWLGPWCEQLGALLDGQDFAGHCRFVDERAEWVMYGSSDAVMTKFPAVDFQITTGGGAPVSVEAEEITLEGKAWIDVQFISLDSGGGPLDLTWVDGDTWRATVPLLAGVNELVLEATDRGGLVVGSDDLQVTATW